VIVFFMIYIIVNVTKCLILTSNISVNYVHIFKVEIIIIINKTVNKGEKKLKRDPFILLLSR